MRYKNAKICDNNHLENATITAPESAPFVKENLYDLKNRNKLYKPGTKTFTIEIDLNSNANNVSFFAMIGASDALFGLSSAATVTLKANSINLFTGGEPYSEVIPVKELGVYKTLSDETNQDGIAYRYWQVVVDDSTNPNDVEIAYLYLGDNTILHRNMGNGFDYTSFDRTLIGTSDSGKRYALKKPSQTLIRAVSYQIMKKEDKDNLNQTIRNIGLHTPFLFVIDPTECLEDLDFTVRPMYFDRNVPSFRQVVRNRYTSSMTLREVL